MPKIRDSGKLPEVFEVDIKQTRRGKKVVHVPVKDVPSPRRAQTASPSKRRVWVEEEMDLGDIDPMEIQIPKRSRTSGKVC